MVCFIFTWLIEFFWEVDWFFWEVNWFFWEVSWFFWEVGRQGEGCFIGFTRCQFIYSFWNQKIQKWIQPTGLRVFSFRCWPLKIGFWYLRGGFFFQILGKKVYKSTVQHSNHCRLYTPYYYHFIYFVGRCPIFCFIFFLFWIFKLLISHFHCLDWRN